MRTVARVALGVVLVVALLFVAAELILPRVIKPGAYKDRVIALVAEKTHRTLQINGPIRLSFFPWLGVRFTRVVLSNPPGFGHGNFASVRSATLRVRVLPLFRREIVIDRITLAGLRLHLIKNRLGANNWSGLTAHTRSPSATRATARSGPAPAWQALRVAGVEVTHANLAFRNQKSGSAWSVDDLSLHAGRMVPGRPFTVSFAAEARLTQQKVNIHIKGKARITLAKTRQAVDVSAFQVAALGVLVRGHGDAVLAPVLKVAGRVTVPPFNAATLLAHFGVAPTLRDPKALTQAGFTANLEGSSGHWRLAPITATLDGSHFSGSASVTHGAPGAPAHYRFNGSVDRLDLDRYRAPAPPPRGAKTPAPSGRAGSSSSFLKRLDADGTLRVGRLTAFGMHARSARVGVRAEGGIIEMNPIEARLYGGTDQGSIRYDVRAPEPVLTVTERLSHVALGPLLRDAHRFDQFSGTADVSGHVTATGTTTAMRTRTLNGRLEVALTRGQIKGFDLAKIVRKAQTVYDALRGQTTPVAPGPAGATRFSTLTASALIRNGVLQNNDLLLAAPPYLDAKGKGRIDLVAHNMNYRLSTTIKKPGGGSIELPVTIRGPFSALSYHVDLTSALRQRAQKRINTERQKLKSRLQRALHDRLKGLLQ